MPDDHEKLRERATELLLAVEKVEKARAKDGISLFQVHDLASRGANLIQSVVGSRSPYAENMRGALKQKTTAGSFHAVAGVIQAFYLDLISGHLANIRHEVEAVVVSEIVAQARKLLRTKGVHPAAAVMVACAGAEEFLRNWCEEKVIRIPEKQRSLTKFAVELRLAGHIELPVERRISSWADYRNDAAHGANWERISADLAERIVQEIEAFLLEYRTVLG